MCYPHGIPAPFTPGVSAELSDADTEGTPG